MTAILDFRARITGCRATGCRATGCRATGCRATGDLVPVWRDGILGCARWASTGDVATS